MAEYSTSILFSGPPELVDASMDAVRQWEYQPTLLNGKPCYVITLIDVNYMLTPQ